jgi:catalase
MAMRNPVGRVNYEPNSWGDAAGPRESPERGFRSFPEELSGSQVRARSETFADHYSQARQFFLSQTPNEQKHLKDALVFELSKVEREDIRARLVSHLLNIYEPLARGVADGLGLDVPAPAKAARDTMEDLPISPALSIVENGPDSFEGRKLGILISDGAEADLVMALIEAAHAAGGDVEIIAPKIGGALLSDGSTLAANQKVDGGPSVLYDAVAIVVSEDGAQVFSADAAARDFASDAFAHCKFIGYSAEASALFESIGLGDKLDDGCILLSDPVDAGAFLEACADLRFWEREAGVDLDPPAPD